MIEPDQGDAPKPHAPTHERLVGSPAPRRGEKFLPCNHHETTETTTKSPCNHTRNIHRTVTELLSLSLYSLAFFAFGQHDTPPHAVITLRLVRSWETWARSCLPSCTATSSSRGMGIDECLLE